jgi:hypothetical protein
MIWEKMRLGCNNPNSPQFALYGANQIICCEEWDNFKTFLDWSLHNGYADNQLTDDINLNDVNINPKDYVLIRINDSDDFVPYNCKWVNKDEVRKKTNKDITIVFHGEIVTINELSKKSGLSVAKILYRYHQGYTDDELIDITRINNNKPIHKIKPLDKQKIVC